MKTKILQFVLTCIVLPIFGQYKFLDLPKLDAEDLKLTSYSKNPSEPAEVLYKTFHYYITDGELHLDVVSRVKIYKKDDAKKFLEEEIYTYQSKSKSEEKITSLKVNTYNLENGKIAATSVDKNSKFKSKENKNISVTKFAFENVKDGSIVEYKYSVLSPFLYVIPKVMIEDEVPIRYLEYVFDAPKQFGYNINYKGELKPFKQEVTEKILYGADCRTYRFAYKDIAAYKDEKYVNNIENYRTSIRLELNSTDFPLTGGNSVYDGALRGGFKSYGVTWQDIRKQLYEDENFGDELKRSSLVKDLLPEDIKSIKNEEQRAAAVLKFTQGRYSWDGEYSAFSDKGIRNLINTKSGNSAEINLLLILLMRSAGLNAEPVLLSTVGRGILTGYSPSIGMLNYVLASIDINGKFTLYDATSKMTSPNIIRPAALNYYGFVMTKTDAKQIHVLCPEKSMTYLTVDAKLNPDGTFAGNFSDRDTMLYAMMNNERHDKDKTEYQKENYKERYKFPYSNIKSGVTEKGDFETSFDFDSDTFVDGIGGKLVFNPLLFLYNKSHEFDQTETRRSPIELYTGYDKIKKVTITLPDGYAFENVPKSKKFRTEDNAIQYVYKVTQEGNKLTVETTTTVEDPVYPKEYYPAFKQIFDNITKMEGQVVTAVKK
ncbi:DUF3857 domain-containing protein [Chryseobacterium sp. KACC 21268]|nr:DUF3857 domain-containing protein [Chryseobacterium sp. KACC 21268]